MRRRKIGRSHVFPVPAVPYKQRIIVFNISLTFPICNQREHISSKFAGCPSDLFDK